ncbi:MAG: hypothetical protein IJ841_06695 [Prevotella sp.]|nr:hypothetical protein [Prevotella sp.]
MSKKVFFLLLTLFSSVSVMRAGSLDAIREALEASSLSQVQEKVYIHTDNTCYFVGDTLWYKAYVVRADDLQPTDMSRILYVELLSPDGLLVERQNIIVSGTGHTCGQFVLQDSLYSGYYELRAYTRWQLNFNVYHHRYRTDETWWFYSKQMAADYFRQWDGLYSRVLPIYSKPEQAGDYGVRRMYQRPKTRLPKQKKDDLLVEFYPEGGHLVQGIENRVAFSVTDQHGEAVNIKGTVEADGIAPVSISTEHMGRGAFMLTPGSKRAKARFSWRGKEYSFSLPKPDAQGVAMRIDGGKATFMATGLPAGREYAVSVLCRGSLKHFQQVSLASGKAEVQLPVAELPSGVCDVTLFDDEGQILADRLFFVNNHEYDQDLITAPIVATKTYEPYEQISLPIQCQGVTEPTNISVSIRDTGTDEPSYDTNDLLTSMLLSSELRGFIAYPDHYFEADDAAHRRHLDLLMMVQGWRKYKWEELADTARQMRYEPETGLTVEGNVYKMLSLTPVEPDEVGNWQYGVGMVGRKSTADTEATDPFAEEAGESDFIEMGVDDTPVETGEMGDIELGDLADANASLGVNHGNLKREVLVEAEISVGKQVVGSVQKTDHGHFVFSVPPFYGDAYLNMKAYKEKDSLKKSMASRADKYMLDEKAFPDFYVKRDVFFPIYTHDYTYYEKHQPDIDAEMLIDTLSELSMENDVYQLANVNVKGKRRGRRAIDYNKPAFVMDAYDLYNDITDRGLSFGMVDMRQFPVQVCKYLFGNMGRYRSYNVAGRLEGHVYYRNFSPLAGTSDAEAAGLFVANRTPQYVYNQLKLKRLQNIRVFTDYEPRTEDSTMVEERYAPDATVDLELIPDDAVQPSFRDRHIVFHGFSYPETFYQPDYSEQRPAEPTDYRRTLYWNPNAVTDENGLFTATFYNNSKQTRIKMTAAGVTGDGRLLRSK